MFALSKRGLRSLRWPFHRPQGRRSPVACRPFLEPLEDRNLLSPTIPTPIGSPATQTQSPANIVGSPQQVILALNKQSGTTALSLFNGPSAAFLFANQPSVASSPGPVAPGSSLSSSGAPFGFLGYSALQNPAVNFRTALGYGPYTQSTPPGLFLVGGAGGSTPDLPPNRPAQPPPPPPPARIFTLPDVEGETADPLSGYEIGKASNLIRPEETGTPALTGSDPESATGIDDLTFLALANAPRLDDGALNADTEVRDLALAEFAPDE